MKSLPYNAFFFLNIMIVCFASLFIAGGAIYAVRSASISNDTAAHAEITIRTLARETEVKLSAIEDSLALLNRTVEALDLEQFARILDKTIRDQDLIRAIYILDQQGISVAVGTKENRTALHSDYIGIDFSGTPLFRAIKKYQGYKIWSDIFVSVLSGDTSVGVGVMLNGYTVIAELSLKSILSALISINHDEGRLWVIDGRGELLADTQNSEEAGILNVRTVPFMRLAVEGEPLDSVVYFDDHPYHVAYSESLKLGWLFLWGTPAGIHNPKIQNTIYDILLIGAAFLVLALIISPIWIRKISTDVKALMRQANVVMGSQERAEVISTKVTEFDELSRYINEMHKDIIAREDELKELNRSLEMKVEARTAEIQVRNQELRLSMDNLRSMHEALVQSEKLASLGRLVAGVAHELNTPIGCSITALSSLKDELGHLQVCLDRGIKKSEFDRFMHLFDMGVDISYRNVERAAELVTSFKHVANDQTSEIRRDFDLKEVVQDVLLTLSPMMKKTHHQVDVRMDDGIMMNSYPGVIVQILTNLINNAFNHAWERKDGGVLVIRGEEIEPLQIHKEFASKWIEIQVEDNGCGIPLDYGKKVFDPFYTSKAGLGGSGLGLNIAMNGAKNILGGNLSYVSVPSQGTTFCLKVPLTAPNYT
jgi:signal transduction histidine kinase